MYPAPPVNHRFNHQSVINLTQINGILPKKNVENQISSPSDDNNKRKNISNSINKTEKSSKKPKSSTTPFSNQDGFMSQPSNLETTSSERATPVFNSHSVGTLHDRIQRERRAHTMAPLTRISGPSSTPQAKLFTTITVPIDNQTNKSNQLTPKSDIEMTDDDTPIIVKVRYDPQASVLPSEDVIRKAVDRRIFNKKTKKEPIIMNFFGQNRQPQIPNRIQQNSFPLQIALQPSRTFSFMSHPPHPLIHNRNIRPVQAPKPSINKSLKIPRLPNKTMNSVRTNGTHPTGFDTSKPIDHRMASQQSSTTINTQQTLSQRFNTGHSSTEVFRPPAVKDIPELSRENLLSMLNQIPDLQGRHFNIEYAPSTAPEGYPIPLHIDPSNNIYPEPVVIDKLPTNIIQHVKSSNNPALTAALEASIQEEQHFQSQSTVSALNVPPPTVRHHVAQPSRQVQQSRPVSSNDSDSSTEVSSSSSEETDSEQPPTNNIPFVGPIPPTSNSQSQYC